MVKKVVTGAHYGTRDWLMQRVSAVVLVVCLLAFGLALLNAPQSVQTWEYAQWKFFMRQDFPRIFTFIFFIAAFLHAWVGLRDILMDYIKHTGIRLTLQVLVILSLLGGLGWIIQILWGVHSSF